MLCSRNWENSWTEYLIHILTPTPLFENHYAALWFMDGKWNNYELLADEQTSRLSDFFCFAFCTGYECTLCCNFASRLTAIKSVLPQAL